MGDHTRMPMGGMPRMRSTVQKRLPLGTAAPAGARRSLEPLRRHIDPRSFESLRLLVTELVNNSVKHSGCPEGDPILLTVDLRDEVVRVEVTDRGAGFTRARPSMGGEETSGWGLLLVDRLSDHWGFSSEGATRTWFELPRRPRVGSEGRRAG